MLTRRSPTRQSKIFLADPVGLFFFVLVEGGEPPIGGLSTWEIYMSEIIAVLLSLLSIFIFGYLFMVELGMVQ